jgi:hypothetical protein
MVFMSTYITFDILAIGYACNSSNICSVLCLSRMSTSISWTCMKYALFYTWVYLPMFHVLYIYDSLNIDDVGAAVVNLSVCLHYV